MSAEAILSAAIAVMVSALGVAAFIGALRANVQELRDRTSRSEANVSSLQRSLDKLGKRIGDIEIRLAVNENETRHISGVHEVAPALPPAEEPSDGRP